MGIFEMNFIELQKMFWQSSYGVKKLISSSILVPSTVPQCCRFLRGVELGFVILWDLVLA